MARPARAAAGKAKQQLSSSASKRRSKEASDGESNQEERDSSDSSSDDDGEQADDYEEKDSDNIDESSDDDDDVKSEEEEDDEDIILKGAPESDDDDDEDDGEEVLDFTVKKETSTTTTTTVSARKRKGKSGSAKATPKSSPSKRLKKAESDDEDAELSDLEDEEDENGVLSDGRKVTKTKLVKAPKSSVKPGHIDPHTMQFLRDLTVNNEREWFARNDARYRHAHKNWLEFVEAVQPELTRGDWSIPEMPAKDLVYRIYRDVRFSNDKTPYKKNFSASFSRTGRKGPFAGYYLQISPNNSLLAAGKWSPDKNDLATIRSNILRSSKAFRKVLSEKKFVDMFGPPKVDGKGKGKRCSVFGNDDMLKVAPKMNGVDKNHKDIDLLKLRTISVVHHFTDKEVLSPDFKTIIGDAVEVMAPLVQLINEMTHPQSGSENEEEDEEEEEVPSEDEKAEVTAASGKEPSDPENSDEPKEEDDEDGMSEGGGIEAA